MNVAELLEKAIQCALKQTYKNIEIVLVDDGSTDGSRVLCEQYRLKKLSITVIFQKNTGPAFARNAELYRVSGGRVYLFR